jgi:hypothetical protein
MDDHHLSGWARGVFRSGSRRFGRAGRQGPRRRLWPYLVVVLVGVAVYSGVAALRFVGAVHQLQRGVATVQGVRKELTVDALTSGQAGKDLGIAHAQLAAASTTVRSGWFSPITVLPYVGRQLQSVRALSTAASTVTAAADTGVIGMQHLLRAPHDSAAQRAVLVGQLASVVTTLQQRVATVSLGSSHALVGVLASKRAVFADDLAKLRSGLTRVEGATTAAARLLRGPGTYLVLAANNAEMRDGSGMFLQAGVITVRNGSITVQPFQPTSDLSADQPAVALGGDLAARWGQQRPNQEWRNLALSPQFRLNAPVAASMWQARSGQHVDGVIAVDVGALADILGATGPIAIGGTEYSAATAQSQLLVTQYDGVETDASNQARRDQLGALSAAVLGGLQGPGLSVSSLARQLDDAVNGRHLLLWSADPVVEAGWQSAGAAGQVAPTGILLGVMNQGANKLDPFQQVTATMGFRPAGSGTAVTVTVRLHNAAPTTLSPYAGDGDPGPRLTYRGTMALDVPRYAGHVTVDGPGRPVAAGNDDTSTVLALSFSVAVGGDLTVVWHFDLDGRHGNLVVDPSARLPATTWRTPGSTFSDASAHTVNW